MALRNDIKETYDIIIIHLDAWDERKQLAQYIANYVNDELDKTNDITRHTILDAMDAFDSGAR